MAKSRSESVSREALPLLSLRGGEDGVAISRVRRGEEQCLARAEDLIAFRHCEERSDEAISKWVA